jgi:hypothetical protein
MLVSHHSEKHLAHGVDILEKISETTNLGCENI